MKTNTKYQYLSDASIRVDNLTLRPWPDFTVIGDNTEAANQIVTELLESKDTFALLWRGKIPNQVLQMIHKYPRCLWRDMLEVSQLHPDYFTQWSQHCPALIALMAVHEAERQTDRDLDRIRAFYRGRNERLKMLGLPATREVFRILSKVPVEDCYPRQLEQLQAAVQDKARRRLLRHLNTITTETLDTLQLPLEYLDTNLLNLRINDITPPLDLSVSALVEEIAHYRHVTRKLPYWPFQGQQVSLRKLLQTKESLELRLALGEDCKRKRLPKPPLATIKSSKVEIQALTSVRALWREGDEMGNCVMTYAKSILSGIHYAYKMLSPQRATILLVKREENWYPVEVRTYKNEYAGARAVDLVHAWTGTIPTEKEVSDDFPF
ncbi:PcfJ domain-containing protein [Coraliomargarita algicola]|uniref:PcfJ domain-containing protein n=1 Tax=Coraliomargarita algicola TaxID=3092156 RepID=A0ABZ0RIE3_9BACT|nr:PcfJ domain-containing protein [Coraliomargarita sp. J2-16]WPJ95146.1 PcfJ domain-containing protein [Coraliomargarita sp. J2-16]